MTARAASNHASGFTLLELIVALGVLGLVAAVALPRLGAMPDHAVLQAKAGEIGTKLRSVRAAALRTNTDQELMIDKASRTFWTSLDARPHHLSGAEIAITGTGVLERGPEIAVIRFRPDGSACDARVELRRGQRRVDIVVDWVSGAARIEWRL